MNFKIGDTLDYESVIGLGICSGKVVGVSNTGEGEAQPLYATVRNQKGNDITVHWTRVVKVHPGESIAHEIKTLGIQTDGSHSDLRSEVERLYIGWSKEIALAAEVKAEYEKVLMEKDVEIQRLKEENETLRAANASFDGGMHWRKGLITELCDALVEVPLKGNPHLSVYQDLIGRAMEATHGT